jgi:DNA-directed RNA polymerase specialized sigma24 family protein
LVLGFVGRRVSSPELAADLLAETFAAALVAVLDAEDVAGRLAELLPEDQLGALRARIVDERDYSEIATDLRCSEAVVRKRVGRALQTLRAAMEGPR